MSSEVYNNIKNLCNKENISHINRLDIGNWAEINNVYLDDYIINLLYPIGSFYVQYPDKDKAIPLTIVFPESKSPNTLFPGTTWTKQWNTESIFFRTEGELSKVSRTNGLQQFGLKQLYGKMSWVQPGHNPLVNSGVFSGNINTAKIMSDYGAGDGAGHRNIFDLKKVLKPENVSPNEIRVKNRLMIVWKRTA